MTRIEKAQSLAENGDVEGAWEIVKALLTHSPNDPHVLVLASYCMQKADNWPVAYHLAKASAVALPDRPEPWLNISATCDVLYMMDEGVKSCIKALQTSDSDRLRGISLMNHASLLINHGEFAKARPIAEKCLTYYQSNKALGNLGMAQLAAGEWQEGWKNYSNCLGTTERARLDYGVADWNGEEGKVIIYGEQGLGDEISFASMLNDAPSAVVDCDYRLKGLFARSFPQHEVNGGRWKNKYSGHADYQCAIGELGKFYRNADSDFPKKAYLIADPLRRSQWKYLKEQVKKPLIGIAWTGGMPHTAAKFRQFSKEQLKQIVGGIDAHFVSLEYKPRPEVEGINVYPHATLTNDYDDTAALVAECDLVITIQTAVAHLAGALGVPCWVFVPETSQWRYAPDKMLWYTDNFVVNKAPWNLDKVIQHANNI